MKRISTLVFLLFANTLGSQAQQLYSNGPIVTGPSSQSGFAAPAGTQWSELQNDGGNTVANSTLGWGTVGSVISEAADDFVIPPGQTWTIRSFRFMGYQPNAVGAVSPFSKLTLRIWRGQPGTARARSLFGDSITNRLAGSAEVALYRISNSLYSAGGTAAPATNRKVWEIEATVSPGLELQAGTYWVSWSAAATGTQAYYFVPVTTVGARAPAGANARLHSTGFLGTYPWSPIIDVGNGANPAGVNVEMAFKIFGANTLLGTRVGQPASAGLRLQASPVPATDAVQITLNQPQGRAQLLLTDCNGRLVWTGQLPPGATAMTVPVAALASGIYFLEARTATGSARTRILKQ